MRRVCPSSTPGGTFKTCVFPFGSLTLNVCPSSTPGGIITENFI